MPGDDFELAAVGSGCLARSPVAYIKDRVLALRSRSSFADAKVVT
jgi:hypothetical protein